VGALLMYAQAPIGASVTDVQVSFPSVVRRQHRTVVATQNLGFQGVIVLLITEHRNATVLNPMHAGALLDAPLVIHVHVQVPFPTVVRREHKTVVATQTLVFRGDLPHT
jgi:hypothetical protein